MLDRIIKKSISGNVTDINLDAKKVIPLLMIRNESIFNYLSDEAVKIIFKDADFVCEPIYKYTKNIPNQKKISYQIFADDRNLLASKLIIVVWEWNKAKDILDYKVRKNKKIFKNINQYCFPHIHSYVHVCSKQEKKEMTDELFYLDKHISSGIVLKDRDEKDYENVPWNEIEIYRSYDWGLIRTAWNKLKENLFIENISEKISEDVLRIIQCSSYQEQHELTFDYPYPIEDYFYKIIL